MLKRKKGYILLTLLVLTGFAGRLTDETLSNKERKFAATHLKDSKDALVKSVKGLSEQQLNFKPSQDQWSVKECVFHLAITEKSLWQMAESALKQPANPEKRAEIKMTDEQLLQMISDRTNKVKTNENSQPDKGSWNTAYEALDDIKASRNKLIKYVKHTTADVRNHVAQLPFGYFDAYQLMLFISAHTQRHTKQIEEVKTDPNFPK